MKKFNGVDNVLFSIYTLSMKIFRGHLEFEWDNGNSGKNLKSHSVFDEECEEVFFDPEKRIAKDVFHSGAEARYLLLGATNKHKRKAFI